jgi:hypothetical protein
MYSRKLITALSNWFNLKYYSLFFKVKYLLLLLCITSYVNSSANEKLRVKGVILKVPANVTLQVSGSANPIDNSAGGVIKVAALSVLTVEGDVSNASGASFEIAGAMTAGGDVTNSGGSSFQIDGHLNINGNWTNDGVSSLALAGGAIGTVEFSGSSAQQLGGTTPSIFENFTINNAAGITLLTNQEITDSLIFTNGIINSVTNILITSSLVDKVVGYGDGNYIFGTIRRYVTSGEAYNLPMGSASHFQLASLEINALDGLSIFEVSFNQSSQPAPGGLTVLGQPVSAFLNQGFWTFTPNGGVTSVSYSIGVQSKGHNDLGGSADNYALIIDKGSGWQDLGTHQIGHQSYSASAVTAKSQFTHTGYGHYIVGHCATSLIPKAIRINGVIVKVPTTATAAISGNLFALKTSNSGALKIDGTLELEGGVINNGIASFASAGGGQGTVKLTGTAVQDLGGAAPMIFENLTIDNSAGVTLSEDQTVTNTLALTQGVVTTGINMLNCTSTATADIAGYSNLSFVNGNLRKAIDASGANTDTYGLPVGNGTGSTDYFLAEFINNNLTGVTALDVSVEPIGVFAPNNNANLAVITQDGAVIDHVFHEAQWAIDEVGTYGSGSYGVRLYLENITTVSALNDNSIWPLKRDDGNTYADWKTFEGTTAITNGDEDGRIYDEGNGYVQRTGYQSFSLHAVGLDGFPLPIELLSFDAKLVNNDVELKWTTTTEINNDYFTIERSADAQLFTPIITTDGAGNSSQVINYETIDTSPLEGRSYYRLKQTDFNGVFSYSDVVPISIDQLTAKNPVINVFPNPSTGKDIYLELSGFLEDENVQISFNDALGKVYFSEAMSTNSKGDLARKIFPYGRLASGTYFLTGISKNEIYHKKLIIQ